MRTPLFFAACLSFATLLRADAPPPVPGLEALDQNGRSFQTPRARLPLRIFDAPGLLGLPEKEQADLLDRVADAGFNTVGFDAPLLGPGGLSPQRGSRDPASQATWTRTFEALQLRRLYAMPALWTQSSIDALIGAAAPRTHFFGGKNALGWQAWALRQAAAVPVKGRPLSATAVVAGWVLYRGPWPDGPPLPGRVQAATPTAEARVRGWARWQVQAARRLGFRQPLGLGLWAKQDLGAVVPVAPESDAPNGAAPFAELSSPNLRVDFSSERRKALDILPPVPGADAELVTEDDSATLAAPPNNPWDLEGLDWEMVEGLFSSFPMATQVDFMELTLDTEDWYRVGDRLAEAAQAAEVPVVWRQDWRTASRYERNKRLAPPPPLAGLAGGWPQEDWPAVGESLWPLHQAPSPETLPFRIRSARLLRQGKDVQLVLTLNRPAAVIAAYGSAWPLDRQAASNPKARGKAEHHLTLKGLVPGKPFLLKVQALSPQAGSALFRTRWVQAPQ